jgi:hypothetical protein
MGRVDDGVDALRLKIAGQTFAAAKAADAPRDRRWRRIRGRACERQGGDDIALISNPTRKRARLRSAAENEQAKALQWATP